MTGKIVKHPPEWTPIANDMRKLATTLEKYGLPYHIKVLSEDVVFHLVRGSNITVERTPMHHWNYPVIDKPKGTEDA